MKQLLLLPLLLVNLVSANPEASSTPYKKAFSEHQRQDDRFRYVNAARLNLREEPSTTARILLIIKAPSVVEVLEDDGEWSMVSIDGTSGYVKSSYLVPGLDEITVEGIDIDYAKQNYGLAYTEPAPVRRQARSSGPSVYYCASGNVVKYHSSSSCRGLSRCSASVDPIPLSDAQSSMNPCKICY